MYSLTDGQVRHLFSIASGTEKPYIFKDKKGHVKHETADTPTGTYHITRTKGPNYKAPLGRMPYARFYDDVNGIAVHSGTVTTKGRLSHGCIHVENPTMKKYIVPYFHKGNTVKVVE
jgi:hypothetical protein